MPSAITLGDARGLGHALAEYLRDQPLDVPPDLAPMLRGSVVGEPIAVEDGVLLPPWRVAAVTTTEVELTWTLDLGHASGVRLWFVARVARTPAGWAVCGVGVAHARRAR